MRITVGAHALQVRAPGERREGAPRVLFLHGAGGTSLAFLAVARRLAHMDCWLLDLPGHGGSPGPAPASIAGFADVAAEAMGTLGIAPCAVVGHSMGAAVAVEIALGRPALVSGLGLVCAEIPLRVHPRLRAALAGTPAQVAEVFAEIGHSPRTAEHVRRANSAPIAHTSITVLRDDLAACEAYDPGARLGQVRAPTVVIAGADDAMTPVEGARRLAGRIPDARLVVVPDAGHMLPVEQPAACAEALAHTR